MTRRDRWLESLSAAHRSIYEQLCLRLMAKADNLGMALTVPQIERLAAQKVQWIRENGLHKISSFKFGAVPDDFPDVEIKVKREVKKRTGPGPEAKLQKDCIDELIKDDWLVLRVNVSAQKIDDRFVRSVIICESGESAGVCDLICGKGPLGLWVELKAERGRLTPQQEAFRDLANTHGVLVYEVRSVETLKALMRHANKLLRQFESFNNLQMRMQ
jgi:hypothetical protein